MAAPSNKSSSSPTSTRVLPNPVLRNSETVNPVRRSFAGSPFMKPSIIPSSRGLNPTTPANSPLDHPQRNSSTYCRGLDEKENGKDDNPRIGRIRSPTITNCTKNFMSPTISASSKISMSPKKKILVDRNELVRTSLSSSDLKTSSMNSANASEEIQPTSVDLKPDDCNSIEPSLYSTDLRPALRASSSSIHKASKTVSFIDRATKSSGLSGNTMFEDADLVNLDYRFKISPASSPSSCQIIAPLDEDPSMPPYDPKTNYLSPRPQFLHYRPNPRIERYLHEEEDGKRVEGSLLFDSFSDTEVTEEAQSDSSQKSDEVSSNGIDRKDKQQEEEEADHYKSERCLIDNSNSDGNSVARGNSQPIFRNIYKITALILLLCFACSSIFHTTPLVNRIVYDESSFLMKNTNLSEIYQFAKSKYSVLDENLQVWFNNAAAFAHSLIFNFQEENHQLSPVRYCNLSALQEDISVDGYFVFYQTHEPMDDFLSEATSKIMVQSDLLDEDELLQNNVELEEEAEENSEIMENPDEPEQECEESERRENLESELMDEDELLQNSVELEKEAEEHSEIMEDQERRCEEEEHQESKRHESLEEELSEENGKSESEMVETIITTLQERPERVEESEQGSLELDSTKSVSSEMDAPSNVNPPRSETTTSTQVILLILLPPLMAAAIFAHSRRVKTRRHGLSPSEDNFMQTPLSREHGRRVLPFEAEQLSEERSSYVKGGRGGGSNGKNHRRESLSSSMSYGSFTAYEKISTKHGDLEEEIMTPVRRSSRIKTKSGVSDE